MTDRPIYLDYQATTPTDPRVVTAMLPYFTERFGNPGSASHAFGREAETAVETARAQVAALIGAEPREIVFTSGATESNNLAIKGAAQFHRAQGRDHIVTVATEHKCVLEAAKAMERQGCRVTFLGVDGNGLVDPAAVERAIDEHTALVSVMAANNEIGTIPDLASIGAICRAAGILFHTDAAQAVGKISFNVNELNVDLASISGHKLYGPKGIGALYVRRRPRARLLPLIDGGGQERGLRSGTLPTPLCVGLGAAAAIAQADMPREAIRLVYLRQRFLTGIRAAVAGIELNGDPERRLPGNLNLSFPGVNATDLMAACPGVAVSSGSACSSAELEPSYVLRALGFSDERAAASIRIGLGRMTTEAEIDRAADLLAAAWRELVSAPAANAQALSK
ncbi:MAG TPA: aminotransferase class V-fold PLP-dependent enzyme [Stellaceae bacterium]|nr:aminotransferase class V-fold PLP-dependent enzyme [Stellaceae bacterium]